MQISYANKCTWQSYLTQCIDFPIAFQLGKDCTIRHDWAPKISILSLDWKVHSIISTPDKIQLCDSRGRVTQFARHQAAHGETSSKTIPMVYLYQILKFLDCTGLPSGTPNNPRRPPTTRLRFVWTTGVIACNLPRRGCIIEII